MKVVEDGRVGHPEWRADSCADEVDLTGRAGLAPQPGPRYHVEHAVRVKLAYGLVPCRRTARASAGSATGERGSPERWVACLRAGGRGNSFVELAGAHRSPSQIEGRSSRASGVAEDAVVWLTAAANGGLSCRQTMPGRGVVPVSRYRAAASMAQEL